jgi:hypothetical protein
MNQTLLTVKVTRRTTEAVDICSFKFASGVAHRRPRVLP